MVLLARGIFRAYVSSNGISTAQRASSALPRVRLRDDCLLQDASLLLDQRQPSERSLLDPNRSSTVKLILASTPSSEWSVMKPVNLINSYLQLSKAKLTALIATTAAGGFAMSPLGISAPTLAACLVGTCLLSASANAVNQLLESPYDAQMKRTRSRLLVVHRFTPLRAFTFATVSAVSGVGILAFGCNTLTAALGLFNVFLYAGVYTPMKRHHVGCTWVGAVVGAIPPLMGYVAAVGFLDLPSLVIAAVVYCWQFPHFNGLSWNLRGDYCRAGYRVMCVSDERLCRATALRHSFALWMLCSFAAPLCGLTTWTFAVDSVLLNGFLLYLSYKFYRYPDSRHSRALFFYSLLYLPLIFLFMFISKCERTSSDRQRLIADANSALPLA